MAKKMRPDEELGAMGLDRWEFDRASASPWIVVPFGLILFSLTVIAYTHHLALSAANG